MNAKYLKVVLIIFLVLPTWMIVPPGEAGAKPAEISLLRIDPHNSQEQAALAGFDLLASDWLTSTSGEPFLIASANLSTRKALQQAGIRITVLDEDIRQSEYTLLYGSIKALSTASSMVPILLREDPLALARTSPNNHARLAKLGLDLSPLVLSPLVTPQTSKQLSAQSFPDAVTPIYIVQEMLARLNSSDLYDMVAGLSGEWAVNIEGLPYTIATRYSYTGIPIKKATRYVSDLLQSYGLVTWYDYYSLNGYERRSVIAQQPGLTHPEKIFLLTAHLDSISYDEPFILAPGADDNASGSAALLRIAEIFSQYNFGCTLRYALFTGEEQGMVGSKAYAADVYALEEDLQAVLNLDMLAYNTPASPPNLELHTRYANSGDLVIANLFRDVVSAYGLQLNPVILQDGKTFSDHSSFWTYGYPAILAIEDWNDHTPYYHTTGDQLETINFPYYTQFSRASLAAFAHLGCLYDSRLAGTVRDLESGQPIQDALIEAWQGGAKIHSALSRLDGSFVIDLPAGSYNIQVHAYDHLSASFPEVALLNSQPTSLDPLLSPCTFVRDTTASADPQIAEVDETITFSASASGEPPLTYSWDFGDGSAASGQAVTHAFISQGTYPVKLTVSNLCGFPQSIIAPVFVDVERYFLPLISCPGEP